MKIYSEFIALIECASRPNFDVSRFDRMIEQTEDWIESDIEVSMSKISSIKRFYEVADPYNRTKIVELINNNIKNIYKVHKIVLDYEEMKNHRGE